MGDAQFIDLFRLGLMPIPLIWNETSKSADSHFFAHGDATPETYNQETFATVIKNLHEANGIALKLFPPFGCIDFDLKNTNDKTIFDSWKKAVASQDDSIFDKICIETTRNKGYHVYIKYTGLKNKVSLAREIEGEEVIAIYTGGTLSYCSPTPGYDMVHNEFIDLDELTADQFDILTSCSIHFDKYVEVLSESKDIIKDYPIEYENVCLQFDRQITDEAFETLINDLTLFRVTDYKYRKADKFIAFLRKGSKAKYSAKVYFHTKNLQLFTASISGFPHWAMRSGKDDTSWNLSPSRIIYYANDRDWISTIEYIKEVSESIGIELIHQQPVTNQPITPVDKLKFPYDIFPTGILTYIQSQSIQNEYLAGAALGAAATMIGNSAILNANDGYTVKPILYIALVAPPGAAKTPALKTMFNVLEDIDNWNFAEYTKKKIKYKQELAEYRNQKKGDGIKEPIAPILEQILIKDSTIEMLIKILSFNSNGCCLLADELSGFLKRMNRYGDNDEVQKWLELWSGSPVLMQRIGREEDKVMNPYCSVMGGIQPGVLDSLSKSENEHNGFYHRFLFVYPEPQLKLNWQKFEVAGHVINEFQSDMQNILNSRGRQRIFQMSDEANQLYAEWFNNKNRKYNFAPNDNIKGIIAKYQDYCLRFSLIIQIMHDKNNFNTVINHLSVERAIRLTEYFLGNMNKSMKILAPVSPIDKINGIQLDYYKALPQSFSASTAVKIGEQFKINPNYCRSIIRRWCEKQGQVLTKSGDQKNAVYDKIFD